MKKYLPLFILVFLVSGCASIEKHEPTKNDRIIYRSLLPEVQKKDFNNYGQNNPVINPIQEEPLLPVLEKQVIVKPFNPHSKKASAYIPFYNESSKISAYDSLSKLEISKETNYFLVGHSHGSSLVGNAKLAVLRADNVAGYLKKKGVAKRNIHVLASWSSSVDGFSPLKGVEVYIVKKTEKGYLPVAREYKREK